MYSRKLFVLDFARKTPKVHRYTRRETMTYFHIYSFILAALPLLLGFLFIWFGKKLWNNAAKKNEEYQQRYTGHTTLRVIRVEKNEWEETNSNEQGPESRISVTSYTPVYEYTVNGQRYEYHTRIGSSIDQYPIGKEYPGYYNPKNPADVTETLNDITGGDNRFFSLLFFGIGVLAIIFALIRISAVITIL